MFLFLTVRAAYLVLGFLDNFTVFHVIFLLYLSAKGCKPPGFV